MKLSHAQMPLRGVVLLLVTLILPGCASFNMTKPVPQQTKPIAVQFVAGEMSGWSDLPPGIHRVPNSQVIISGHQKGGAAGLLFGVIGVAVQSAVNSSTGKEATANLEKALEIDLTDQAQAIADELIASQPLTGKFAGKSAPGAPTLSVISSVVVSFVSETDAKTYVVLKASLKDGQTDWSNRYIASSGAPLPFSGPGSWTAEDGALLRSEVTANLRHAIAFMLGDLASPYPRDDNKLTMVQGYFPHVKTRLQSVGYLVTEDAESISFIPKLGDALVFSGVNIMDKAITTYRPATKDDAIFKVVEEEKK